MLLQIDTGFFFRNVRGWTLGLLEFIYSYYLLQSKLFPTIQIYWKRYQAKMLATVKNLGEGIVIAGDGRHDSMGHTAKFGAYTIFCCTIPMILHFNLIQVSS